MNLFDIPRETRTTALRALKSVALANGRFDAAERAMLVAAARTYDVEADVDALGTIAPEELAASIGDEGARRHVLQACLLMSLSDQSVTDDELAVLDGFRRALDVREDKMKIMHDLAKGNLRFARLHAIATGRKGLASQMNGAGLTEILRVAGALGPDEALVRRFQALASLPDGTLGREYVRYRETNGFPWPGEKGGVPEGGAHHDLTHVLTGYPTDPLGEIQIGAFTAGMKKTDPFMFLLFPMLEFHVGLAIRPGSASYTGHYDAGLAFRAHEAGARCKVDLTDHWDFWSVIEEPVAKLRRLYAIEPLSGS